MSLFVTFEGIEGCGKSTQAELLAEHLRAEGREVTLTHEPGGTEHTREIRRLLADPDCALDDRAELFLFLADRAQHVRSVIQPALERGAIVVCDRYSDSTMAYQGYGRGHDVGWLEGVNEYASYGCVPGLTLWIDCDIATGLARARKDTGGPGDRFEAEPLPFHTSVRQGFAELCKRFPERIVRIDGNLPIDEVTAHVIAAVAPHLP